MGNPGGKPPTHFDPFAYQYEQAFMFGTQQRSQNQHQPLRPTRCRYCGSRYSEKSLRDAKCENCGATL